jgi:hypothetical protein
LRATELLANTGEIIWYTIVASVIGRRTMRANWSRMYDMHTTVLGRMQAVEKLIVEHGLGRMSTGRHTEGLDLDRVKLLTAPGRPEPTMNLDPLLCRHSEPVFEGRPPRRARILHRGLVLAKIRVTPIRAGVAAVIVMLLAVGRAVVD